LRQPAPAAQQARSPLCREVRLQVEKRAFGVEEFRNAAMFTMAPWSLLWTFFFQISGDLLVVSYR
jgi:hypothetical protein